MDNTWVVLKEVIFIIKICDAIMGTGKTSAAINMMNEDTDQRYLFVTQLLTETDRIKTSCPKKRFAKPAQLGEGKLGNLHQLLKERRNIASSHSLFHRYTEETLQLIRDGHYMLVLDEVIDVIAFVEMTPFDVQALVQSNYINIDPDTKHVTWIEKEYNGTWRQLRTQIETSYVTCEDKRLLVWMLPIELFNAFDDVIVLTYMFEAQLQNAYFKIHNVEFTYIGVEKVDGKYQFTDQPINKCQVMIPEIHIVDNPVLNEIGNRRTSLSSTWHARKIAESDSQSLERLRKNLYNVFHNVFKAKSKQILWSTYSQSQSYLKAQGYTKSFLAFNARATNDYHKCQYLAYVVNVFLIPDVKIYFTSRGSPINDDAYALSTMLQWLWRSALRDGKEVWLYLPSKRMRTLLTNWLEDQKTKLALSPAVAGF